MFIVVRLFEIFLSDPVPVIKLKYLEWCILLAKFNLYWKFRLSFCLPVHSVDFPTMMPSLLAWPPLEPVLGQVQKTKKGGCAEKILANNTGLASNLPEKHILSRRHRWLYHSVFQTAIYLNASPDPDPAPRFFPFFPFFSSLLLPGTNKHLWKARDELV